MLALEPSVREYATDLYGVLEGIREVLSDLVTAQRRTADVLEAAFKVEEEKEE